MKMRVQGIGLQEAAAAGSDGKGPCLACGVPLTRDDVGMTKKLINRGAKQFYCIPCLAAYFGVDEAEVLRKLREFKEMGCTLFV